MVSTVQLSPVCVCGKQPNGEEGFFCQRGQPALCSNLHAENWSFQLSDQLGGVQLEEERAVVSTVQLSPVCVCNKQPDGEEGFCQSGRPALCINLHAENGSFHVSDPLEEERGMVSTAKLYPVCACSKQPDGDPRGHREGGASVALGPHHGLRGADLPQGRRNRLVNRECLGRSLSSIKNTVVHG